jgi:hypothetical protein
MNLTDEQREVLKEYVFDQCLSCMFGDGLEREYILGGFPAFKGIDQMTDDELIEEAGCDSQQALDELLKEIEES